MANLIQSPSGRGLALALVCIIAVVGVAASCASLSVSLMAAAHACCHTERADLSCLTLCAASESDAVLTVAGKKTPMAALVAQVFVPGALTSARSEPRRRFVSPPGASPPLYVLHSAFLI